jgi:hypothetical protein
MFQWLVNLFSRRDSRYLFRYWDGAKQRALDPVAAYRKIWSFPECDLIEDSKVAMNPPSSDGKPVYPIGEVYAAEDRLRTMAREIFGVQEWTEKQPGLTVDETDELLNRFMAYCADLKKKRNPLPISSAPSASREPGSLPATAENSPPGPAPDSACSPSESTVDALSGP